MVGSITKIVRAGAGVETNHISYMINWLRNNYVIISIYVTVEMSVCVKLFRFFII